MAEVDSTEQSSRVALRDRFAVGAHARPKPRGAARSLEFISSGPDDPAARYGIEQLVDGADSLGPARIEFARRLRSREAEFLEAFFAHVRAVAPDAIADDAQLKMGLRDMIAACIDCGLESIEHGESWSGTIPSAVTSHARHAACSGVSLTIALRRCVAGHTLAWSVVLNEIAHHDLPDEQRFGLLLQASAAMGSLLERVQTEIADAHSSEIRRRARSLEQRRVEIVQKLLAGASPDVGERAELGYDLDGWHIAVIATGADADKAVRSLQAGLGCELLMIARGGQAASASLGAQRRIVFEDIERVVSMQAEHTKMLLAVGESARGLDGLRVTHREAESAAQVARYEPRRITRYADVEPEAAVVQDEALADSLIERYLLPLDDMPIGGLKARATLHALFGAEHHISSAANKLKLNRSTLHRRREDIQQRLGCRLQMHQSNIERALRIEEWRKRARP
jgi:sugar diacid utilization regulator